MVSPQLAHALDSRLSIAESLLGAAVALEIASLVDGQVVRRLRARPHFLRRTPNIALKQMRTEIDGLIRSLAERLEEPVRDLRVFLGAAPRRDEEEAQALAVAFEPVVEAARQLLTTWVFPGDDKPDLPDESGVDLDARYDIPLELSPGLLWAWRHVRGLDNARNRLADGGEASLVVKLYLPEALPEDPA